jgi:hypothetical protein
MPNDSRREDLFTLARLLRTLNTTLAEIGSVLGRPAQVGHAGEFIASIIFDIDLHPSASNKDHDGYFGSRSPLAGRSVNVKWGTRQDGLMDLSSTAVLDHVLVLMGPRATASSVASNLRPWVIESVYLFDPGEVIATLRAAGVGVGTASSVRKHVWEAAMIHPEPNNPRLIVTEEQKQLLSLFAPQTATIA